MSIYRHYKKKLYKVHGFVKHSETLEDLVHYDCLYENSLARVWVRPKDLFFGTTMVDGKEVPRFVEVKLTIQEYSGVSDDEAVVVSQLVDQTLGGWDSQWFYKTLEGRSKTHLAIAYLDDKAIGFKIGYEKSPALFYSWLGGVLPEYRNLGVATELMRSQHSWCKGSGFKRVQTKTLNQFKEMLLLNIKAGFEVTGVHNSDDRGLKIILEKNLSD